MTKAAKRIKVLIVEDEVTLNKVYVTILQAEGMDVRSCFNGRAAIEMIEESAPDIILLDLRMPIMGGLELLEQLNPKVNYPKTKIIVFSNFDDKKDIDKAFELGAHHYMLKAWASPKELRKLIDEVLAKPF